MNNTRKSFQRNAPTMIFILVLCAIAAIGSGGKDARSPAATVARK